MTELITNGFDYSELDTETIGMLENFAWEGRKLVRKSHIKFIADFGEILSNARKLLANKGDGTFALWAIAEFDLSKQTIYNYVNAWDRLLCKGVSQCETMTASAIYALTSHEAPLRITNRVLKMAGSRSSVHKTDIEELLEIERNEESKNSKPVQENELQKVRTSIVRTFEQSKPSNSSAIPNSSEHDKFDQSSDEGDGEPDETPTPATKAQPPELSQKEQAANVRKMAQAYIDKAVRAVDDLNEIKANVTVRNRLVKMLQDAGGMLW